MLSWKNLVTLSFLIILAPLVSLTLGQPAQEVVVEKEVEQPKGSPEPEKEIRVEEKIIVEEIENIDEIREILKDIKELDPEENEVIVKMFKGGNPGDPQYNTKKFRKKELYGDWSDSYIGKDMKSDKLKNEGCFKYWGNDPQKMYNNDYCGSYMKRRGYCGSGSCGSAHWVILLVLGLVLLFLIMIIIILLIIIIVILLSKKHKKN